MSTQQTSAGENSIQVGISIYKQPLEWIQQCVESALAQVTQGELQVTARCDGPEACNAETLEWLLQRRKQDQRLQLIQSEQRLGTFGSYRAIFQNNQSDFLCQLDADDWLETAALAESVELLSKNKAAPYIYTYYNEVSPNGSKKRLGTRSQTPFSHKRMLVQFITYHLRVIRRSAYNQCGGYNPGLRFAGDYDLALRLSELGAPINLPKPLYNYRLHDSNTSGTEREATIKEAFEVAERALKRREKSHLLKLDLKAEESRVTLTTRKGPIAITGMHRSGTSLLALMLQHLGIDIGTELIPGDHQNPDGYGEDPSVVKLQREALQRNYRDQEGWPDWGWTAHRPHSTRQIGDARWTEQAKEYLDKATKTSSFWGWKDPRTTLFLEHWLKLEPNLKVIAVYRDPWEVVNALQSLKPPVFAAHPEWALQIWLKYNKALARFAYRHPDQCIVIHSKTIAGSPEKLIDALIEKWGFSFSTSHKELTQDLQKLVRSDRLRAPDFVDQLKSLHLACSATASSLLHKLDNVAIAPAIRSKPIGSKQETRTLWLMKQAVEPELSIIVTSHNQGDLLLEAIASAEYSSKHHRVELVIIDDGSDQTRTLEVLQGLEELGYSIIRQANKGLTAARNAGIAASSAQILAFLDDDNRLLPAYLNQGLDLLRQDSTIDVVYGNMQEFGASSRYRRVGLVNRADLWEMNRIDNCVLMRRGLIERCGGYDPALPAFEDWDLWLTALGQPQSLKLGYLDMPCFEYRVRPGSMLQRLFRNPTMQKQIMEYLRNKHGPRVGHGGFNYNS